MPTSQSQADKARVAIVNEADANGWVYTKIGSAHVYTGGGAPNHVSSKGALFIDTTNGKLYVNATGLANGWAEAT